MDRQTIIYVAEEDHDRFLLIRNNLHRGGISNQIVNLGSKKQMEEALLNGDGLREGGGEYVVIVDMDKGGGCFEGAVGRIKGDPELRKIPVIVLARGCGEELIGQWHDLGCVVFAFKSNEPEAYAEHIEKIGRFLSVVEIG